MGEIADALRRARIRREPREETDERARREPAEAPDAARPREPEPPPPEELLRSAAPGAGEAAEEERVSISRSKRGTWAARALHVDPEGPVAQAFRQFAVRLGRELAGRKAQAVAVTSDLRGAGKTTTACNLALAFASVAPARPVALVDLDLRKPAVDARLRVAPRVGIEQVLAGEASLREATLRTDVGALELALVDHPTTTAHELFAGPRVSRLLAELRRRYELVVIDTAPVLAAPDVALLAEHVDAIVPVVRSGSTRRYTFHDMLEVLPRRLLVGAFLNEIPVSRLSQRYAYYSYRDEAGRGAEERGD